jgi:hypothetical protein
MPKADDEVKAAPAGAVKARGVLDLITRAANTAGADVQIFNELHVAAQELVAELEH